MVDPGVGTEREGVIVKADNGRYIFVGPNNGIFTQIAKDYDCKAYKILDEYFETSSTFHGRDIFAPTAAKLVEDENRHGEEIDLITLDIPEPMPTPEGIQGHVLYTDKYGNLLTDVKRDQVEGKSKIIFEELEDEIQIVRTFGEVPIGNFLAYVGSSGRLEIAVNQGSAEEKLMSRQFLLT